MSADFPERKKRSGEGFGPLNRSYRNPFGNNGATTLNPHTRKDAGWQHVGVLADRVVQDAVAKAAQFAPKSEGGK